MADTYAIVESGGKQYRAEKGSELVVDRLPADEGDSVTLRAVMFRDDGNFVLAGDDLEKVKVEAKVAGHLRGTKLRVFKYKPKKGYRRRAGHRSELTRLEVTEVKMLSRKPAAKGKAKPKAETKAEAKPKAETKKGEAKPKAAAGRKPAGKAETAKGAGKAGTAKKPATKKTATKKTPAKKAATKKAATKKKASAGKASSTRKASEKKQES